MDDKRKWDNLDGRKKAAIVLLALGKEASSAVIKKMDENDVEDIAAEISSLGPVPSEVEQRVLGEYTKMLAASAHVRTGGVDRANELLESALGKNKASEIANNVRRFHSAGALRRREHAGTDVGMVSEFLKGEHPQTVALVVAQSEQKVAGKLLAALPEELRSDVVVRIATMDTISPDISEAVGRILSNELQGLGRRSMAVAGGVKILAEILNAVGRATEKELLTVLEEKSPEVALQIKQLMFVFDDILLLDDKSLQKVLRNVETKELAVALKAADEQIKQKIFKNMSERASQMIKDEIDYMGPKRLSEVEHAQQRIMEAIRVLEEAGELVLPGRGGDAGDTIV